MSGISRDVVPSRVAYDQQAKYDGRQIDSHQTNPRWQSREVGAIITEPDSGPAGSDHNGLYVGASVSNRDGVVDVNPVSYINRPLNGLFKLVKGVTTYAFINTIGMAGAMNAHCLPEKCCRQPPPPPDFEFPEQDIGIVQTELPDVSDSSAEFYSDRVKPEMTTSGMSDMSDMVTAEATWAEYLSGKVTEIAGYLSTDSVDSEIGTSDISGDSPGLNVTGEAMIYTALGVVTLGVSLVCVGWLANGYLYNRREYQPVVTIELQQGSQEQKQEESL